MTYDLGVPAQLMAALLPDLTLMGGAILLLLAAAWRPESDDHQRLIGRGVLLRNRHADRSARSCGREVEGSRRRGLAQLRRDPSTSRPRQARDRFGRDDGVGKGASV